MGKGEGKGRCCEDQGQFKTQVTTWRNDIFLSINLSHRLIRRASVQAVALSSCSLWSRSERLPTAGLLAGCAT